MKNICVTLLVAILFCLSLNVAGNPIEQIDVQLNSDKSTFLVGEDTNFTIEITNNYSENITLTYPSSIYGDFQAIDEQDDVVYEWTLHNPGLLLIMPVTLGPNQTTSRLLSWNLTDNDGNLLSPGNYTIRSWTAPYSVSIGNTTNSSWEKYEIYSDNLSITIAENSTEENGTGNENEIPYFDSFLIISTVFIMALLIRKLNTN